MPTRAEKLPAFTALSTSRIAWSCISRTSRWVPSAPRLRDGGFFLLAPCPFLSLVAAMLFGCMDTFLTTSARLEISIPLEAVQARAAPGEVGVTGPRVRRRLTTCRGAELLRLVAGDERARSRGRAARARAAC